MTDHSRTPEADGGETVDPDPNRRRSSDEDGCSETFPEQPAGPGTKDGLAQGDHHDLDAVAGDAAAPEAIPEPSTNWEGVNHDR